MQKSQKKIAPNIFLGQNISNFGRHTIHKFLWGQKFLFYQFSTSFFGWPVSFAFMIGRRQNGATYLKALVYLSICKFIPRCANQYTYIHVYQSVSISVCQYVRLSVYQCLCLSVAIPMCLSVFNNVLLCWCVYLYLCR